MGGLGPSCCCGTRATHLPPPPDGCCPAMGLALACRGGREGRVTLAPSLAAFKTQLKEKKQTLFFSIIFIYMV